MGGLAVSERDIRSSIASSVRIAEVHEASVLDEIYAFRVRVWRASGGVASDAFPRGRWRDGDDKTARHWIAREPGGRLVAAARLTLHATLAEVPEAEEYLRYVSSLDGPIAAPARFVVCPSMRGGGLGRRLLAIQDETATSAGARFAVCQASPMMIRLLVSQGWRLLGVAATDPRFPGVPFQVATLDLATSRRAAA